MFDAYMLQYVIDSLVRAMMIEVNSTDYNAYYYMEAIFSDIEEILEYIDI